MKCFGSQCSKKAECARFVENGQLSFEEQVCDYSTSGYGSSYTDENGKTRSPVVFYCGDNGNFKEFLSLDSVCMEYSVGDAVLVRTMAELKSKYHNLTQTWGGATVRCPSGYAFTSYMEQNCGKVCYITEVLPGKGYYLNGDSKCIYTNEMLIRITR